jgi:hypothetical protein
LGGWYIITLNYHLQNKLALYGEAVTRSQQITSGFFAREFKTGISYNFQNKESVFVGFGNYKTYSSPGDFKKPLTANENRIWEQFILVNNISRIKIEHRYRIEQRWINHDFYNRFRYRLAATVALNHTAVTANTFFSSLSDEVFFGNKSPYFLRNRFYAGLGYQFNKLLTLQTGFTRQFDYRTIDNGSGKNYILTSLVFNTGNFKK